MKKTIKDDAKLTLTYGQLKKLVKESMADGNASVDEVKAKVKKYIVGQILQFTDDDIFSVHEISSSVSSYNPDWCIESTPMRGYYERMRKIAEEMADLMMESLFYYVDR